VMVILWTRNLSLDLTDHGGSSFMASSMTGSPSHNGDVFIGVVRRVLTGDITHFGR
jgi:hypothetical protein